MKFKGIEGMTLDHLQSEVARGGKFVVFEYCVSIVVMTFKRSSNIYFIKAGESTFGSNIKYTLLSLVLGWWGFPWGPVYTVQALITNFNGGKDVTQEVMTSFTRSIISS